VFRYLVSLLLVFSFPLYAELKGGEEDFAKKIVSYLIIKDFSGALETCQMALKLYPHSQEIKTLMIKILSESGQTIAALELFRERPKEFDLRDNFSLVESLAWGVLLHNEEQSEMTRLSSLIGAYLTRDARAVNMLVDAIHSSNAFLRSFGIYFSVHYRDRLLQKEILQLLQEEKNWFVRQQLIQAVGNMKLEEAEPELKKIVESRATTNEEKGLAIEALVSIFEEPDADEIDMLLVNQRMGMRQLGLAMIDHFELFGQVEKILPLLKDPSPSIRIGVLGCLGTLGIEPKIYAHIQKDIEKLSADSHPEVAIMASWLALQYNENIGREGLKKWIGSADQRVAQFAASVAGGGGVATISLVSEMFDQVTDPFVKVNLALGMIKQREHLVKGRDFLKEFLASHKEKIMWMHGVYSMFNVLSPSEVRHVPHIPHYPALVDQMTRLELLNILSIADCTGAKELIKEFLHTQSWGVVGSAAVLVLEEGDMEAIDIVRELLDDGDEKIRIQAALALAFYGRDPSVVRVLESAYAKVDWEKKISILEALGFIGSRESIPFLMKVLEEPFQLLRTVAASSIIQCLYH
jgi:HEAT repeat protein